MELAAGTVTQTSRWVALDKWPTNTHAVAPAAIAAVSRATATLTACRSPRVSGAVGGVLPVRAVVLLRQLNRFDDKSGDGETSGRRKCRKPDRPSRGRSRPDGLAGS